MFLTVELSSFLPFCCTPRHTRTSDFTQTLSSYAGMRNMPAADVPGAELPVVALSSFGRQLTVLWGTA